MIIQRISQSLQLGEYIKLSKSTLVFRKDVVSHHYRFGGCLCHCPHQSYIEHKELEGTDVFIKLEWQSRGIHSRYLVSQSCVYQPLDGHFEVGGTSALLHCAIDKLFVFLGKLGRNAIPYHVDAGYFTCRSMLGEVTPIVGDNLLLYSSHFFPSLFFDVSQDGSCPVLVLQ